MNARLFLLSLLNKIHEERSIWKTGKEPCPRESFEKTVCRLQAYFEFEEAYAYY